MWKKIEKQYTVYTIFNTFIIIYKLSFINNHRQQYTIAVQVQMQCYQNNDSKLQTLNSYKFREYINYNNSENMIFYCII